MKNTFGNNLSVTIFGESHGPSVGVIIDGLAPGVAVDEGRIAAYLSRRRPSSLTDTPRVERDAFQILSGVKDGISCGTPITVMIPNENTRSSDYNYGIARPAHADYAAYCKYHGFEDFRGGGHFSGRVTAGLVAAGGILLPLLAGKGIHIGTHILRCGEASDRAFTEAGAEGCDALSEEIAGLQSRMFPVLDEEAAARITDEILRAAADSDSIGGVTETAVAGLPAGLGEPWFDSAEGLISHAVFSIGAIKGIEFGKGFELASMRGSRANDPLRAEDGRIYTETNNNGGINGGITNGMPVLFRCAVKPTPSISSPQRTVNFLTGENADLEIRGRHDPAVIRRICPVIDSVCAIVICDMLTGRYGTDWLAQSDR